MAAYFAKAKLGETFYGQPVGSSSSSPVSEFEIIGLSEDFITAARLSMSTRFPQTLHVFSRHTGTSSCGWAHVSTFQRAINYRRRKKIEAWIILLLILAGCVSLAWL